MTPYEKWSLIISVLIFISAIFTVVAYYRQLKTMQEQLAISLEASVRSKHVDLLKIALSDDDILAVWQCEIDEENKTRARQHIFVNLHLSHLETLYRMNYISKSQVMQNLEIRRDNEAYKRFWEVSGKCRYKVIDSKDSRDKIFYEICAKIFGKEK